MTTASAGTRPQRLLVRARGQPAARRGKPPWQPAPLAALRAGALLALGTGAALTEPAACGVLRVKAGATGAGTGASWQDAFPSLGGALLAAAPGDEIWVAAGVYQPGDGSDPAQSFELRAGVAVYGGFAGSETARAARNPDPATNATILSGDRLGDDAAGFAQRADNSHHVVTASGLAQAATLDGFTIRGGNGLAAGYPAPGDGGGLLVTTSAIHMENLRVTDNQGDCGGGAFFDRSNATVRACSFEGNESWLASPGGGIGASGCSLRLSACVFRLNVADAGGGIDFFASTVVADNLVFDRNEARYGAGLLGRGSEAMVFNSRFLLNHANWNSGGAAYSASSEITFVNTAFAGNHAAETAGAIYVAGTTTAPDDGSHVRAVHCTFHRNSGDGSGTSGGAIYCNDDSFLTLQNSILWDNPSPHGTAPLAGKVPEPDSRSNLIEGGLAGCPDTLDAAPRFVDALGPDGVAGTADDDLRLALDSPAIGAGDPSLLPPDAADLDGDMDAAEPTPLDLDGRPRLVKLGLELGACEVQALSFHAPDLRLAAGTSGAVAIPAWLRGAADGDGFSYQLVVRSGAGSLPFASPPTVSADGTLAFTLPPGAAGHASLEMTVTDLSGTLPSPPPQAFVIAVGPLAWRADGAATGAGDGSTWPDAIPSLTDALARALPGDQVWLAAGHYRPPAPDSAFEVRDGIALYGGFDGDETALEQRNPDPLTNGTVLDGDTLGDDDRFENRTDNATHVLRLAGVGPATVVDGLTIRGGEAIRDATEPLDGGRGGGILTSGSPTLRNLLLTGNRAGTAGGALYSIEGAPQVTGCRFEGNESLGDAGAATLWYGSEDTGMLVVEDCVFAGNHAANDGGAVSSQRDMLVFRSCRFEGNSAAHAGGALDLAHSSCSVVACDFVANQAYDGAAVDAYNHGGEFINVRFLGNRATYGGGACRFRSGGLPLLANALFSGNQAGVRGGAIDLQGAGISLVHATLAGNAAARGGGLWCQSTSPRILQNCILWGNHAGDLVSEVDAPSPPYLTLAAGSGGLLVRGGWPNRPDALLSDPAFADPPGADGTAGTADDDLTPTAGSAACGTGLPGVLPADEWDLDGDADTAEELPLDVHGNPRRVEPGPDLGAIEVQSASIHLRDVRLGAPPQGPVAISPWIASLDPAHPLAFSTTVGPVSGTISFTSPPRIDPDGSLSFELTPGTSGWARIDVDAGGGAGPEFQGSFHVIVSPVVHHVRAAAPAEGNGTSWDNAFRRLADALAMAAAGDEIRVAAGVYHPAGAPSRTATFALKNGVRIRGGYAGTETTPAPADPTAMRTPSILSGAFLEGSAYEARAWHVVTADNVDATAVLESFVIRGGRADGTSSFQDRGAGVFCRLSAPVLRSLAIIENSAPNGFGGGIHLEQALPTIDACFIGGNTALEGAGIHSGAGCAPVVVNSVVNGNRASRGGGLYLTSTAGSLVNCTLTGNTCTSAGGAVYGLGSTSMKLHNTILRRNATAAGAPSEVWGNPFSSANVANCFIAGGYRSLSPPRVSVADPLLANPPGPDGTPGTRDDDVRLLLGSPATDAGLASWLPPGTAADFHGSPRVAGLEVDPGAIEGATPATFALLHPALDPAADDNSNGLDNFTDYAVGADPAAPHDPSLYPILAGRRLALGWRSNAADVVAACQKSHDLVHWHEMIEGTDYAIHSATNDGARTRLVLELLPAPATDPRLFFRQRFSSPTP